jgi:hypothetical protein
MLGRQPAETREAERTLARARKVHFEVTTLQQDRRLQRQSSAGRGLRLCVPRTRAAGAPGTSVIFETRSSWRHMGAGH